MVKNLMVKKTTTEFVILWEFRVKAGKRRAFERAYGPDGQWAELFRSGKGYLCTELIRDLDAPRRYLTMDIWDSREAYMRFKKENRAEYGVIDEKCAALTEGEALLGAFERLG